jgi:hypothetical protein
VHIEPWWLKAKVREEYQQLNMIIEYKEGWKGGGRGKWAGSNRQRLNV